MGLLYLYILHKNSSPGIAYIFYTDDGYLLYMSCLMYTDWAV
jgi:hypothetical protein